MSVLDMELPTIKWDLNYEFFDNRQRFDIKCMLDGDNVLDWSSHIQSFQSLDNGDIAMRIIIPDGHIISGGRIGWGSKTYDNWPKQAERLRKHPPILIYVTLVDEFGGIRETFHIKALVKDIVSKHTNSTTIVNSYTTVITFSNIKYL